MTTFASDVNTMLEPPNTQSRYSTLLLDAVERGADIRIVHGAAMLKFPKGAVRAKLKTFNDFAKGLQVERGSVGASQDIHLAQADSRVNSTKGGHHEKIHVFVYKNRGNANQQTPYSTVFVSSSDINNNYSTWRQDQDPIKIDEKLIKIKDTIPRAYPYRNKPWTDVTRRYQGDIAEQVAEQVFAHLCNPHPVNTSSFQDRYFPKTNWPEFHKPASTDQPISAQIWKTAAHKGGQQGFHPYAPKGEYSIFMGLVNAIRHAEKFILMVDQVAWHHQIMEAIADRLEECPGLQVGIITNTHAGGMINDMHKPGKLWGGYGHRNEQIRNWNRLFPYLKQEWDSENASLYSFQFRQPSEFTNTAAPKDWANDEGFCVHWKFTLIDDVVSIAGTAASTAAGQTNNPEIMVALTGSGVAQRERRMAFAELMGWEANDSALADWQSCFRKAIADANRGDTRVKHYTPKEKIEYNAPYPKWIVNSYQWGAGIVGFRWVYQVGDQSRHFKQNIKHNQTEWAKHGLNASSVPDNALERVEIKKDGNCLFNALSVTSGHPLGTLRDEIAEYALQNIEKYKAFLSTGNYSPERFLEDLSTSGGWASEAGDLAPMIAAQYLERPIIIYNEADPAGTAVINENAEGQPIYLLYSGGNHYDALVLRNEFQPKQRSF